MKELELQFKPGLPNVPGHYLCCKPDGMILHQFVTLKDIDLARGAMPWWLGEGYLWCGPIKNPTRTTPPACGDCDPCLGGRPDQCALLPNPTDTRIEG